MAQILPFIKTESRQENLEKGKPVERPGRKATGLIPNVVGHGRRAAEGYLYTPLVKYAQRRFFFVLLLFHGDIDRDE